MINIKLEAMRKKILEILDNYHVELQEAEGITNELLDLYNVIDPVCVNCGKGKSTHSKEYNICSDRYDHFRSK